MQSCNVNGASVERLRISDRYGERNCFEPKKVREKLKDNKKNHSAENRFWESKLRSTLAAASIVATHQAQTSVNERIYLIVTKIWEIGLGWVCACGAVAAEHE